MENKNDVVKIVIHKGYGAWRICMKDLTKFLKFKGIFNGKHYYEKDYSFDSLGSISNKGGKIISLKHVNLQDMLKNTDSHKDYFVSECFQGEYAHLDIGNNVVFYGNEKFKNPIDFLGGRFDTDLIKFIEENGITYTKDSKLEDLCMYNFKVVYIPSDVDYEIQDYDGSEYVVERHRSWS